MSLFTSDASSKKAVIVAERELAMGVRALGTSGKVDLRRWKMGRTNKRDTLRRTESGSISSVVAVIQSSNYRDDSYIGSRKF